MGARPLYWSYLNKRVSFSSLPIGLLAVPGCEYDLNEQGLYDFLCVRQGGQAANMFQGMNILPPGALLQFSAGEVRVKPFFEFNFTFENSEPRAEAVVEQLSELMAQATQARLRTTGGVASQLSSGLDSSIVTAFAARALHNQGKELHAFTATPAPGQDLTLPPGWYADEGPGARAISSKLNGVAHHLVSENRGQLSSVLAKEIELINAPVLFPCNLMWHDELRRLASENSCNLMLNGNRGNLTVSYDGTEILGASLGDLRLRDWLSHARAWRPRLSWRSILNLSLAPHFAKTQRLLNKIRGQHDPGPSMPLPISAEFAREMASSTPELQPPASRLARDSIDSRRMRADALLGWESAHYDMADNALGIDVRDPTADRRVVQYCLSLPLEAFCNSGKSRQLGSQLLGVFAPCATDANQPRGYQGANWRHDLCRDLGNIRKHFENFLSSELHRRYLATDACLAMLEHIDPTMRDNLPLDHQIRYFVTRALSAGLFLDAFGNNQKERYYAKKSKTITKIEKDLRPPHA